MKEKAYIFRVHRQQGLRPTFETIGALSLAEAEQEMKDRHEAHSEWVSWEFYAVVSEPD